MPVGKVAESLCQCADLVNAAEPERERCLIVCGAEIPPKNVKCRPCSMDNHSGQPCLDPRQDWPFPTTRTCANCGFDLGAHSKQTDGSPNGI